MKTKQVKVVAVSLRKREKVEPTYRYLSDAETKRLSERRRPARPSPPVSAGLLAEDPALASMLSQQIRLIMDAVARLEHATSARPAPSEVMAFRDGVRAALDKYIGSLRDASPVPAQRAAPTSARRTKAPKRR